MNKILKEAIETYGDKAQINKAVEELAELIVAIHHNDRAAIVEEIADVEIMLELVKYILGISEKEIDGVKTDKLIRLRGRLNGQSKQHEPLD